MKMGGLFLVLGSFSFANGPLEAKSAATLPTVMPYLAEGEAARQLLRQACDNQYRGRFHVSLDIIETAFPRGRDSLSGLAEFADDIGERKINVSGPGKAFEYKSLDFGKEQWMLDARSHRMRRIANRQWKKGVFGSLLTYEDMLKLPVDFLREFSVCKGLTVTDSSYTVCLVLSPSFQSLYQRLEVTLKRNPVLLRSIDFFGPEDRKLKSMEIISYQEVAGKSLPSELSILDADSLSSLRISFGKVSLPDLPVAQKLVTKAKRLLFSNPEPPEILETDDEVSEIQ